jgi:hypothetical protein
MIVFAFSLTVGKRGGVVLIFVGAGSDASGTGLRASVMGFKTESGLGTEVEAARSESSTDFDEPCPETGEDAGVLTGDELATSASLDGSTAGTLLNGLNFEVADEAGGCPPGIVEAELVEAAVPVSIRTPHF